MAFPTIYIDTGGAATNSGSSDNNSPDLDSVGTGRTAAVSGGTVTFSGAVNLSGVATDGSATIYIADATNSNQKIFKITGVNDGADTLTVTPNPTGTIATSAWAIGGRHVLTVASITGAVTAGWTVIFNNSPASSSSAVWTFRGGGSSADGQVVIKGKTGTRPVLTNTSTGAVVAGGGVFNPWVENLELVQQGGSGDAMTNSTGTGGTYYNVKVSDAGADAISSTHGNGLKVIACELTGVGDEGMVVANSITIPMVIGCYIHDVGGNGIEMQSTSPNGVILNNIIDTCTGSGIIFTASIGAANVTPCVINGNTIYNCGASGLEVTDADTYLVVMNNLFQDNGNAGGEANVEWVAGNAENVAFHAWNLLYDNTGADGPINFTVGAHVSGSELTTDPLMTNPGSGDFRLGSSSPAKATGFPGQFLGGPLGYLDLGAVQRQESGGGGGGAFTFA